MERYWLKNKEWMMNLRSSVNHLLAGNRNEGARTSERTSWPIAGVVALVLVMVTFLATATIVGAGATEPIPPNVALTGQNRAGCVASSGPLIGQSVFPGEAAARSMAQSSQAIGDALVRSVALTGQSPVGYVAAGGPLIGQSVFPGEALARSMAQSSQPISEAFVRSVALTGQSPVGYVAASGPVIGQSVFPGEALAHSLALSSQAPVDYYGGK